MRGDGIERVGVEEDRDVEAAQQRLEEEVGLRDRAGCRGR